MNSAKLDATDSALLQVLQKDSRTTIGEIAELLHLSTSPCWRRLKRLEKDGLIEAYSVQLSRRKLGLGVTGFVLLQMESHALESTDAFEREVMALDQVLACYNLSGHYDYQLEVVGKDLDNFSEYVRTRIRSLPGVRQVSTSFSLREVKRTHHLPLGMT
jgi:Lrp/AsnC family leucine-responsive transcriptional regulator